MCPTRPANELTRLSPRPWEGVFARASSRANSGSEMQRAVPFVVIVCVVAMTAAAIAIGGSTVKVTGPHLFAAVMLAGLGVAAEMLNYEQVKGASGSISIIPFAAAALCTPSWASLAAIGIGSAVVQVLCKRHWVKAVFNVAQMVLGLSLA